MTREVIVSTAAEGGHDEAAYSEGLAESQGSPRGDVVLPRTGVLLGELRNPDIVGPQGRGKVAALFLHHCNMMGDRRRVNLPLIGFKPNPIIVRSDSQGSDAIQELV